MITILLTLTLVLSLAACGGEKPAETTAPETTVPETTVPETTVPETTVPETTVPETTEPVVYDSFYYFYDYENNDYIYSDIATFHAVAGAECVASALDFGFLENENYEYISNGYDSQYAVFLYTYDAAQLDTYVAYLESLGFTYLGSESFVQGESNYYKHEEAGWLIDIFARTDDEGNIAYLALEPCVNNDPMAEESYYYFYDYESGDYIYSDVKTYQSVTGANCIFSTLDFGFVGNDSYENIVEGYDERYAVFTYEYDEEQFEAYTSYLESIGYEHVNTVEYDEGKSYFYQNKENGYLFDLFLQGNKLLGYRQVTIEPYLNASAE